MAQRARKTTNHVREVITVDTSEERDSQSVASPLDAKEYAFRKRLMERMIARRNRQVPLDIHTDQLVREARAEAYGDEQ
jgi:hypothetical protein